ncbi:MAG TPA: WhiB family transcriptional regulator [Aldersonia sp.]
MCARCPVVAACRDHAMDAQIVHGIWGGMSPRERKHHRWLSPVAAGPGIAPTPVHPPGQGPAAAVAYKPVHPDQARSRSGSMWAPRRPSPALENVRRVARGVRRGR